MGIDSTQNVAPAALPGWHVGPAKHDDSEREFAYTTGAEKALEQARTDGWTVVSIRNDWASVFGPA